MYRAGVPSPVKELRSHTPWGTAKNKIKNNKELVKSSCSQKKLGSIVSDIFSIFFWLFLNRHFPGGSLPFPFYREAKLVREIISVMANQSVRLQWWLVTWQLCFVRRIPDRGGQGRIQRRPGFSDTFVSPCDCGPVTGRHLSENQLPYLRLSTWN